MRSTIGVMIHQPQPIADGVPPYAIALAERGRDGRLVVYAGAGMSMDEPTGLPAGADLARILYQRLKDAFPGVGCDPANLTSVADAIAAEDGGEEALRQTAPRIAEFTTATPSYAHRILALLLLEGVVDVLTTNWDNCVERSGGRERVASVVTQHDLLDIPCKSVLKIHGCATQPASLLITTDDLDEPPQWVSDQTRSRLGMSVVAFVGIGDVAGYVRRRIEEAIASIGNIETVRIVSPGIVKYWDSSPWSELIPGIDDQQRIPETADCFLERVGAAYVYIVLADLAATVDGNARLEGAFEVVGAAIKQYDALRVLLWARAGAVVAGPGVSVLTAETMSLALLALGLLLQNGFQITSDGLVVADDRAFEVLVSVGTQPASRLRRESENRLAEHLGRGLDAPTFLIAGGIGWSSAHSDGPIDIVGGEDADDLIDGPWNAQPVLVRAEEVIR